MFFRCRKNQYKIIFLLFLIEAIIALYLIKNLLKWVEKNLFSKAFSGSIYSRSKKKIIKSNGKRQRGEERYKGGRMRERIKR